MSVTQIKIGMTPPHPGEFFRDEILDELGLSVAKAAEILDVRRATLSNLINGKASLSPEMALALKRLLASAWTQCFACKPGTTPKPCAAAPVRST